MAKVSILLPTYNREPFIKEAIECVLNQSFADLELCISDNCSSDSTWDIIQHFCKENTKIKAIRQPTNIGPVKNWKACAAMATAPYSKLLFSDDLISKSWLENTLGILENDPDAAFVVTPAIISETPFLGEASYNLGLDTFRIPKLTYLRLQLLTEGYLPVSPGAMIFRTPDLINNLHISLDGIQDYDFNSTGAGVDLLLSCLVALKYPYAYFCPKEVAFFRSHMGSITIENKDMKVTEGYKLARTWLLGRLSGRC